MVRYGDIPCPAAIAPARQSRYAVAVPHFMAIPVSIDLALAWSAGRIGDRRLILDGDLVLVPRRPAVYLMTLDAGTKGIRDAWRWLTWFSQEREVQGYFWRTNVPAVQRWSERMGAFVTFTEADGDQRFWSEPAGLHAIIRSQRRQTCNPCPPADPPGA